MKEIKTPTDLKNGLTSEQVQEQIVAGNVNKTSAKKFRTNLEIIRDNTFTYFNLIFIILAGILIYFRSFNNLFFLFAIILNTVAGIIQEINARNKLKKIDFMSVTMTPVLRDGRLKNLPIDKIVEDDIIGLVSGMQISVDAVVVEGSIHVNEANITGEEREVEKSVGDELYSGSFIVSGKAKAQVVEVGDDTFVAKLASEAQETEGISTAGMMSDLDKLIKAVGIVLVPTGIILFINQYYSVGLPIQGSVENAAAAVIGMIPTGLYLLVTLALVAASIKLSRKNTLVQNLNSIEALARMDVLCLDKTGTITEPDMKVDGFDNLSSLEDSEVRQILIDFVLSMDSDNQTMITLQNYYDDQSRINEASRIKPFSSAASYSAIEFSNGESYVLGAAEKILAHRFPEYSDRINNLADQGKRVLLLGKYTFDDEQDDIFAKGNLNHENVEVLALVLLYNPVRKEAAEIFNYLESEGVKIKVISGDSANTVSSVAQAAKITDADNYIDASTLTDEEDIENAIHDYTVLGRVSPEQKRIFINSLKDQGNTVAMVGDGVNDVLALKRANIGLAMASGTQAASSVADIVLLDSNFANMPEILKEGRQVINNIELSAGLYLAKNMFSLLMSIFTILANAIFPLKPAQISIISGLFIGFPSVILAAEANHKRVSGRFLANVMYSCIPAAATGVIAVLMSQFMVNSRNIGVDEASTIAFYAYAFTSFMYLVKLSRPFNTIRIILLSAMVAAFAFAVTFLDWIFSISAISQAGLTIIATTAAASVIIYLVLLYITDQIKKWNRRRIGVLK